MQLTRLAFIGVRGHQETVVRELNKFPAVRVVGLSDGGAEPMRSLTGWCEQHGHQPVIESDYRLMLDHARPEAVVICGPFESHATMAMEAIRRGIHTMVEKPAALDVNDLERLQDMLASQPDVHFTSMQTARHHKAFFTAWRLIQDGAIGDVRLINARKSYKLGNRGAFYSKRETYGGTIPWVGSHAIDWVLWLGGHRVQSAFATQSAQHNSGHGTMERSALAHFTLCGERFASVSIDLFRPTTARTHGDDWVRVVGTNGVLEATPDGVRLINQDHDGATPVTLQTPPTMFDDFVAHVEGRRIALNPAADVLAVTGACLLARQAADEGRPMDAAQLTDIPLKCAKPHCISSAPAATPTVAVKGAVPVLSN